MNDGYKPGRATHFLKALLASNALRRAAIAQLEDKPLTTNMVLSAMLNATIKERDSLLLEVKGLRGLLKEAYSILKK